MSNVRIGEIMKKSAFVITMGMSVVLTATARDPYFDGYFDGMDKQPEWRNERQYRYGYEDAQEELRIRDNIRESNEQWMIEQVDRRERELQQQNMSIDY